MDFDKVIEKRKSVRDFTGKVVSWKDILYAVDTAIKGPAAGGDLPLTFLIVEHAENIDKVAEQCEQDWIKNASIVVLVVSDDKHLENQYGDRGRVYCRQQAGAAINTMLLKLVDLGLGACWVGSYSDAKLRRVFDIPSNKQIEAVIPVGYESTSLKGTRGLRRKKRLVGSLNWEKWGKRRREPVFLERMSKADIHGHPL